MNAYYSVQTGENSHIRMPMVGSLSPQTAIILGAIIANKNPNISELLVTRGDTMLGYMMGYLLIGDNLEFDAESFDLASQEALALSKMLVSDIVSVLFDTFADLEKAKANAGIEETEDSDVDSEDSSDMDSDALDSTSSAD